MACMHTYGAHSLFKIRAYKQSSRPACMQADLKLAKITTSHFQVLNTPNANGNRPNLILIASLTENFTDCK